MLLLLLVGGAAAATFSFTVHASPGQATGAAACLPQERDALLAFKQAVTSDPEDLLGSWQRGGGHEQNCCRWRGVRCSNLTGHVLKLQLRNRWISYEKYGHWNYNRSLTGEISPSLLSLQHLRYLDVSMNGLQGATGLVPEFLGSLKNLRYLNLSGIPFSGSVPPQLGNLSKLHYLDLSSYPPQLYCSDLSWLIKLQFLTYLNMLNVNLEAVGDHWPHVLNKIPSLRFPDLTNCKLNSANQMLSHINLTKLEELTLDWNNFYNPIAFCWFWNLTSLKLLSVSSSNLYGQLPDALGGMESLQYLSLSYNSMNSTTDMKNLCNLRILDLGQCLSYANITDLIERLPHCPSNKLQELHLHGNQLTGMEHLTSLVILDLNWNNITGSLPAIIGHFTGLRTLDLALNRLTGHVPSEIGMLHNLTNLNLGENDLNGLMTEEHLDGLQSLEYIDLSKNKLKIVVGSEWIPPFRLQEASFGSCQLGPMFPAWLKWQVDIFHLDISSTGIIDRLPDWFSDALSKVMHLDISNNQVSGELPTNMANMSLQTLLSSSNQLTGQIPQLPKNLDFLDISRNSLSGPLPSNFWDLKLHILILYSNYFTRKIPVSICDLSLDVLNLANNLFEGELPQCLRVNSMAYLLLSNNSFSGKFPPILQSGISLSFLDLGQNRFSGTLPMWIGNLVELKFLRLSHNMFYGHIPMNITSLTKLYHLNIAGNMISGVIPPHLPNLTAMTKQYILQPGTVPTMFQYMLGDMPVVAKRRELNYQGINILMISSIDLSCNYLAGEIPEEITALEGLINLNLSWNQLNGEVPNKIGDMQQLESLDLSKNKLSGEIPSCLSNLTSLSILDLSYNNLTGRIPPGRQLDTIYAEYPVMYNGNSGLCGPPLQRKCPGSDNDVSNRGDRKRNGHESGPTFFYFGLGLGCAVWLCVVFCVLLFNKAWRIAYFCLFDKVCDKVYVFVVVTWVRLARKTTTN